MATVGYLCQVPTEHCTGGQTALHGTGNKNRKIHASRTEAFRCHVAWFKDQGYTQIGPREFLPPDEHPMRQYGIQVLTKKSHYGGRVRSGKEGRNMVARGQGGELY